VAADPFYHKKSWISHTNKRGEGNRGEKTNAGCSALDKGEKTKIRIGGAIIWGGRKNQAARPAERGEKGGPSSIEKL